MAFAAIATAGPVEGLREAAERRYHEAVIDAAAALLGDLPTGLSGAGYRLPLGEPLGYFTDSALIGERIAYVRSRSVEFPWQADPRRLNVPPLDPLPIGGDADTTGGDAITAIDLATGRPLWTRLAASRTRCAIDPLDDSLWAWNVFDLDVVQRFDATTGAVAEERPLPPAPKLRRNRRDDRWDVRGLVVGGRRMWSPVDAAAGNDITRGWQLDLDAGTRQDYVHHPALVPPKGRARLNVQVRYDGQPLGVGTGVSLSRELIGQNMHEQLWQHDVPGVLWTLPVWLPTTPTDDSDNPHGGDVLVVGGEPGERAFVRRLDGASGAPVWTCPLDGDAFTPGPDADGSVGTPRGWTSLGLVTLPAIGPAVAALCDDGTVVLLNPDDGLRLGSARFGVHPDERLRNRTTRFLAPAGVANGRLVTVSMDAVEAQPLGAVLQRVPGIASQVGETPAEAILWSMRARSLIALDRTGEAVEAAQRVAGLTPTDPAAWKLLADATDSVAPRVVAMRLAGREHDATLARTHGLAWRLPTGPIAAPTAPMGAVLLVATKDAPELLEIDPFALRVIGTREMPYGPDSLWLDGRELWRSRGKPGVIATFSVIPRPWAGPPDGSPNHAGWPTLHPNDPLLWNANRIARPSGFRDERWTARRRSDAPPTRVGQSMVRPLAGGGSLVLDLRSMDVTEHPPRSPSPEALRPTDENLRRNRDVDGQGWTLEPLPGRPLGYGPGGIYRLDAQSRPIAPPLVATDAPVTHLAANLDQSRLAAVVGAGQNARLLTLRGDAEDGPLSSYQVERAVDVDVGPLFDGPFGRLLRLEDGNGGGFFFAGAELVFVADDPHRPAWRFTLNVDPDAHPNDDAYRDNTFGTPRVIGRRLFAPRRGGDVFVFDIETLVAGSAD